MIQVSEVKSLQQARRLLTEAVKAAGYEPALWPGSCSYRTKELAALKLGWDTFFVHPVYPAGQYTAMCGFATYSWYTGEDGRKFVRLKSSVKQVVANRGLTDYAVEDLLCGRADRISLRRTDQFFLAVHDELYALYHSSDGPAAGFTAAVRAATRAGDRQGVKTHWLVLADWLEEHGGRADLADIVRGYYLPAPALVTGGVQ